MSNWDKRFILLAHHVAQWSKDPSTKVGCVLVNPATHAVISMGFNGFPRGVEEQLVEEVDMGHGRTEQLAGLELDPVRWARPAKYDYNEHAERNAIYNAARLGLATEGSYAYLNWNPAASICPPCARAFIQAGVVRVYGPFRDPQDRADITEGSDWREKCAFAHARLVEAGVSTFVVPHLEVG